MAAKTKKVKTVDKWRKKRYFSLLAPKILQERELGQTMAYEPGELQGRCITTNLMVLTDNIKKQHINVTFRVVKVLGDTGFTMVEKYEVVPAAIKRKVRRMRDRLDDSFLCVTKDNKLVRMKPMAVTAGYTSRVVKSKVRRIMMQHILTAVRKSDYDSLVVDVVNDQFQKGLWGVLNKITPLRSIDVRVMKYMGDYTGKEKVTIPEIVEKPQEAKKEKAAEEESVEGESVEEAPEADEASEPAEQVSSGQ
jgi:small subunit ribosomal protein S3Ae